MLTSIMVRRQRLGPRMFWEADELAYVVAPDGKADAGILDIGTFIPFFDCNFCGRKIASSCRRRMPPGMRCGACFGIQPAAAPHYICPWNATNITSRFQFYCVPCDRVAKAQYKHRQSEQKDSDLVLKSKLLSHVRSYFGDYKGMDEASGTPEVARPDTGKFVIDCYNSTLLNAAFEGCLEAVRATRAVEAKDPLEIWTRKGDEVLRQIVLSVHLDVHPASCGNWLDSSWLLGR